MYLAHLTKCLSLQRERRFCLNSTRIYGTYISCTITTHKIPILVPQRNGGTRCGSSPMIASSTPSTADRWRVAKTFKRLPTSAFDQENSGNATGSRRQAPYARWCTISNSTRFRPCWDLVQDTGQTPRRRMATKGIHQTFRDGENWPTREIKLTDSC